MGGRCADEQRLERFLSTQLLEQHAHVVQQIEVVGQVLSDVVQLLRSTLRSSVVQGFKHRNKGLLCCCKGPRLRGEGPRHPSERMLNFRG